MQSTMAGRPPLVHTVRSEWTKIRTLRSTRYLLVAVVVVALGLDLWLAWAERGQSEQPGGFDIAAYCLSGLPFGQLVAGIFGAHTLSSEYSSGSIRSSLSVQPARGRLFAAKLAADAAILVGCTLMIVAVSYLAGEHDLAGRGLRTGLDATALRQLAAGTVTMAGWGLIGFGLAALLRTPARAVTGVFALYLVIPVIMAIADADVSEYSPTALGDSLWQQVAPGQAPSLPVAAAGFLAYVVAVVGLGAARFVAGDVGTGSTETDLSV
ncbi:MAG TPA: ABC transporter permease subunit [Actinocrinis sp.]|jgi:RsiW-degrading membrane proteinase PrsW (M82 family)